jgi:hypothetical protein
MNTNSTEIKNEIVNEIINAEPAQAVPASAPPPVYNRQGDLLTPEHPDYAAHLAVLTGVPIPAPSALEAPPAATAAPQSIVSPCKTQAEEVQAALQPEVPPPAPAAPEKPKMLRRHRGCVSKISRLPETVREWVNECLLRNTPGHIIVDELEERGFPDFNEMNISNWRRGPGYKDWLKLHEDALDQQARRDLALAYAHQSGCSLGDALYQVGLDNLYQIACKFDTNSFLKKMESDPELFLKLNKELVNLLKANKELNGNSAHKGKDKEIPPSQRAVWRRRKGGLTLEERDAAEKRMHLFE